MSFSIKRLFITGFPGLCGGAATELHHQIIAWLHMGKEVHIIPSYPGSQYEPLYQEMLDQGVIIHEPNDWQVLERGDPVFGFCNAEFLESVPEIRKHTSRTIFVNCMTWLFQKEKELMEQGLIAMFLYQNEEVRQKNMPLLKALNEDKKIAFLTFRPYFHNDSFPFVADRPEEVFTCGHISRPTPEKFAKNILHIYEYFVAPVDKKGLFLGFNAETEAKIGKPDDWIQIAYGQSELSQQDFYKQCDIILQPTETRENWPRIGFEAMASGSVLIVDNRGGWKQMVKHGETGWLCNHERDFIYYASIMAYEPYIRKDMAEAARLWGNELGGLKASVESWEEVFEAITKLLE